MQILAFNGGTVRRIRGIADGAADVYSGFVLGGLRQTSTAHFSGASWCGCPAMSAFNGPVDGE